MTLDDRPAFVKIIKSSNDILELDGFVVMITDFNSCNINLKKGGKHSMIKTVVKALEGFEKLYDEVSEMKANLEADKAEAIKVAVAEVEDRYAEKSAKIDELFAKVSVTEEIEVPDEVTEDVVTEETEEVEAQPSAETLY